MFFLFELRLLITHLVSSDFVGLNYIFLYAKRIQVNLENGHDVHNPSRNSASLVHNICVFWHDVVQKSAIRVLCVHPQLLVGFVLLDL
jgi:hypothetical protein